jgi:hypothetical protein
MGSASSWVVVDLARSAGVTVVVVGRGVGVPAYVIGRSITGVAGYLRGGVGVR